MRLFGIEQSVYALNGKSLSVMSQTSLTELTTIPFWLNSFISESALERTVDALSLTGVIPKDTRLPLAELLDLRVAELHRDIHSMKLYNKPELVSSTLAITSCSFCVQLAHQHFSGTVGVTS